MPRKVSFSTLREVTVNIEDTVEAEGEARPPPDACKPGGPTRASTSLVYLLLLAALALPWAVTAYAVLYNSGAPPTLAAPPPSRTPPARLLVTEPAHGLVVTPSTSFALRGRASAGALRTERSAGASSAAVLVAAERADGDDRFSVTAEALGLSDAFVGGGAPGDGRQLSEAAGAPSMEGHMPLVLSRLVLENGVLDLAVSRIDPAAAAAGGGGYYSYSEP